MCFGVYRRGWCLSSPVCPSTVQSTPLTIVFLALAHTSDRTLSLTHTVVGALREVLLASIRPPLVCPISLLVVSLRRVARQRCKLAPDPSGRLARPANQLRLPAGVQKGIEAAQASGESGATLPTGQPEGQTARQRPDQPASQPARQTNRQTDNHHNIPDSLRELIWEAMYPPNVAAAKKELESLWRPLLHGNSIWRQFSSNAGTLQEA